MIHSLLNLAIHYFHNLLQLSIYILSKLVIIVCIFTGLSFAQTNTETEKYAGKRPRIVYSSQNEAIKKQAINFDIETENSETLSLEKNAFEKINQYRNSKGLPELIWNDQLAKVARLHSSNMAKYKFFNHEGIDGKSVEDRARSLGLTEFRGIGENICYNQGYENPVQTAVNSWINSGGHRENLLRKIWKESAIGVAIANDGTYYFTELFLIK